MEAATLPPVRGPHREDATDDELVDATRRGDDRAFERLYERHHRRIAAYALGMLRDRQRAEDVTQEVFLRALRHTRATDGAIAFGPWIREIARNACIDQLRRARRTAEVPFAGDDAPIAAPAASRPGPDAAVLAREQLDELCGAFGSLSETHHRILVLRELEGRTYEEIGRELEMTRPAVESTLFRARRRLGEEYGALVSGERCRTVQAIIAAAQDRAPGLRDRRTMARHVAHCQPCRRAACLAGVADLVPERAGMRARIAALLPLPAVLRDRWLGAGPPPPATADAASGGGAGLAGWLHAGAPLADGAVGWAKAVAAAATIAAAGVGAGAMGGASGGPGPEGERAPAPHVAPAQAAGPARTSPAVGAPAGAPAPGAGPPAARPAARGRHAGSSAARSARPGTAGARRSAGAPAARPPGAPAASPPPAGAAPVPGAARGPGSGAGGAGSATSPAGGMGSGSGAGSGAGGGARPAAGSGTAAAGPGSANGGTGATPPAPSDPVSGAVTGAMHGAAGAVHGAAGAVHGAAGAVHGVAGAVSGVAGGLAGERGPGQSAPPPPSPPVRDTSTPVSGHGNLPATVQTTVAQTAGGIHATVQGAAAAAGEVTRGLSDAVSGVGQRRGGG